MRKSNDVEEPLLPVEESQPINGDASKNERVTPVLVLLVLAIVLSAFNFGYNIGVINSPKGAITCANSASGSDTCLSTLNSWSSLVPSCIPMSESEWSYVVSAWTIGGLIGGLTGGRLADQFGRRNSLIINTSFFLVGAMLMFFSINFAMLLIGRIVSGYASGVSTVVVPMFLGEVSPSRLRGAIGTLNQLMITIGILVAQLMAIGLSSCPGWRYLLGGVQAAVAILQAVLLILSPRSPSWLISKGKKVDATDALEKIRGTANVHYELKTLSEAAQASNSSGKFTDLFASHLIKPLIIGVGLQMAQQLSGINAVFYYSTSIFQKAGVSNSSVATAIIGIINVVATIVTTFLMDKAGRRSLVLISQVGQVIFLILLALSMIFSDHMGTAGSYILVGSVLLFVCSFAIGMGPVPWIIISEIFPSSIRGYAMSIAVGVNWISNFIVALTFPAIEGALGSYTFLLFGAVVFAFTIFTFFLVPETKGKSIEEITGHAKQVQ